MPQGDIGSLWRALGAAGDLAGRHLWGVAAGVKLGDLARGSSLGGRCQEFNGRSVLLATRDQLAAALALIELDGVARRLVLCPPDLPPAHIASVMATAEVDAVVSDRAELGDRAPDVGCFVTCSPVLTAMAEERRGGRDTEWILLTSGTTGVPKLVVHNLASLAGPTRAGGGLGASAVWSTFYDIRRYGGLQMFFRALLGGGSLVLSDANESTADFLQRAGARTVTHISGTPSHWRSALMSPAVRQLEPRYVRLSGEIADQAILDHLRAFFSEAAVSHAFATTEAGVGFEVDDGLAGFPASLIERPGAAIELKIVEGSLRIRSSRTAGRYLGAGEALADGDGFVDTGDMVERQGERYYFVGRRDGVINVGGRKVHPEEVETVINAQPGVRMALVRGRRSPITGAVVVADVVMQSAFAGPDAAMRSEAAKGEILAACRRILPPHKVPATIRFVPSLVVTPAGKLDRQHA